MIKDAFRQGKMDEPVAATSGPRLSLIAGCYVAKEGAIMTDRPPRVERMDFQLADGRLVGPRDMLGDISFDRARRQALEMADYMLRNGPFEPGRLPIEDLQYVATAQVAAVHERREAIEEPAPIPV